MNWLDQLLGVQAPAPVADPSTPAWGAADAQLKRKQAMIEMLRKTGQELGGPGGMVGGGGGGGRWLSRPAIYVPGNNAGTALAQAGMGYVANRMQRGQDEAERANEQAALEEHRKLIQQMYGPQGAPQGQPPMSPQAPAQQAPTPGFDQFFKGQPAQTAPYTPVAAPQGVPLDFPQGASGSSPSAPQQDRWAQFQPALQARAAEVAARLAGDEERNRQSAAVTIPATGIPPLPEPELVPGGGGAVMPEMTAYGVQDEIPSTKASPEEAEIISQGRAAGLSDAQISEVLNSRFGKPPVTAATAMPPATVGAEAPQIPDGMQEYNKAMLWAGNSVHNPFTRPLAQAIMNKGAGLPTTLAEKRGEAMLKQALSASGVEDTDEPSAVRVHKYYMSLPTDAARREFLATIRAQQVVDLGDSKNVLGPQGQFLNRYPVQPKPGERPELRGAQEQAVQEARNRVEKEAARPAKKLAVQQARYKTQSLKKDLADAMKAVGPSSAGLAAQATMDIGGTPAANLKARLTNIGAQIAFATMQELKSASPSGATGLGAIAIKEFEALQSTLGSIDQKQSPQALTAQLLKISGHLDNIQNIIEQGYADSYGAEDSADATPAEKRWRLKKPGLNPKLKSSYEEY